MEVLVIVFCFRNVQNFKEWAEDFDAYSNQSNEILDTLDLFIQLTKKKLQASSRPASFSAEVCSYNSHRVVARVD